MAFRGNATDPVTLEGNLRTSPPPLDICQAVIHLKEASMQHEKAVFRQFALPVSVFDHLKQFQRDYEQRYRVRLTNNQVLAIILKQHQSSQVEKEGRGEE